MFIVLLCLLYYCMLIVILHKDLENRSQGWAASSAIFPIFVFIFIFLFLHFLSHCGCTLLFSKPLRLYIFYIF